MTGLPPSSWGAVHWRVTLAPLVSVTRVVTLPGTVSGLYGVALIVNELSPGPASLMAAMAK